MKSGFLSRDGAFADARTGAPQGGMLSPLLAGSALSVLDERIAQGVGGSGGTLGGSAGVTASRMGLPDYWLVRYAGGFLVLVFGRREHAGELCDEVAEALKPVGLGLSVERTGITRIDEGVDFLGWRIRCHRKGGTDRQCIYTCPARKFLRSVMDGVEGLAGRQNVGLSLESLLHRLNSVLRGWCAYFCPGVSGVAFCYLSHCAWMRVTRWIRRKRRGATGKQFRRRCDGGGWWPVTEEVELFDPARVSTTGYRYRGKVVPAPWPTTV